MLDAVAEFGGVLDIVRGEGINAFDVDAVELQRDTKGQRGEDGDFVRSVGAVDIKDGSASA